MKVEALLCSCNEVKMKRKPIKRPVGCYNGRRKSSSSSSRKGHSGVPRGGWLGAVRKKLMLKTNNKNIIIIHNNTSITSNDDDIRASSSVDPPKDLHLPALPPLPQDKEDLLLKPDNPVVVVAVAAAADPAPLPPPPPPPAAVIVKEPSNITDHQRDTHKPLVPEVPSVVEEHKLSTLPKDDPVDDKEAMAAITIQTTFRSHLARRAFRALKSLVRLQAVVRGVVVRRQARMALHCMRALLRLGDRVRTRHLLTHQS